MLQLVAMVLRSRRPSQVARVNASEMAIAARVGDLMGFGWGWPVSGFAYELVGKDAPAYASISVPVPGKWPGEALDALEWYRDTIKPRLGLTLPRLAAAQRVTMSVPTVIVRDA